MIPSLPLRVPGFDAVLGGGLPEYSFNLIAGGAGTGKTTLGLQIAFGNARAERPAIFFTVLGEPTLKILRYQRQFSFFDPALVGSAVEFINLSDEAMQSDPGKILSESFRRSSGRSQELWSWTRFDRSGATGDRRSSQAWRTTTSCSCWLCD